MECTNILKNKKLPQHFEEYTQMLRKSTMLKRKQLLHEELNDFLIFFGANEEIILQGIGLNSGSYFPGENGTIIMCEHNYMNNFNRIGELSSGDIIDIRQLMEFLL